MNLKKIVKIIFTAICLLQATQVKSQIDKDIVPDTLFVKLDSLENIFLRKNLLLLAQRFNIDAQHALIDQAKLFSNPTMNVSNTIYQTETKEFFPFGDTSEVSVGLSQVIQLAGKHNKQVKLAIIGANISEYQFYDLLRTLKHALQTDYYNIHFLLESAKVYDTEISALQKVADAFEQQKGKGYISEKEVIRVKAQLYNLQNEYSDLKYQISDSQSELRLLLQMKNMFIVPDVNSEVLESIKPDKYPLATLIDSAYSTRPDLKIAKLNTDQSIQNYNLQKAIAVPDLTVNLNYDQQGSYIHNLTTLGFAFDLPFFNRNQGNIKSAKSLIKYNQAILEATQASVNEEIYNSLHKAYENDKLLKSRDVSFEKDFKRLLGEVLKNYQVRNTSLLDFLDFYESFKQNTLQINTINFNRVSAFIDLDYYSGINYLKY